MTAVPVWFDNAGWPPSVIEYVTVALSADSTNTFDTFAFVDFANGDAARAEITGAKVCPFCSNCSLRAAGVAPSKNSLHAAVICAASADPVPDEPAVALLLAGVALGDGEVAVGDEPVVVDDVDGEELLHPAAARITTAAPAIARRVLSNNQTTTALPFSESRAGGPVI